MENSINHRKDNALLKDNIKQINTDKQDPELLDAKNGREELNIL